eukprot:gene25219-30461_t
MLDLTVKSKTSSKKEKWPLEKDPDKHSLWSVKYAPKTFSELYVHHSKKNALTSWLERVTSESSQVVEVLCLHGSSGSDDLESDVLAYNAFSKGQIATSHTEYFGSSSLHSDLYRADYNEGGRKQQLSELTVTSKYPSLNLSSTTKSSTRTSKEIKPGFHTISPSLPPKSHNTPILLIEDPPAPSDRLYSTFELTLLTSAIPIVILTCETSVGREGETSEGVGAGVGIHTRGGDGLSFKVKSLCNVVSIHWPEYTEVQLKKILKKVASREGLSGSALGSEDYLGVLAHRAGGDARHALLELQIAATRLGRDADDSGGRAKKKSRHDLPPYNPRGVVDLTLEDIVPSEDEEGTTVDREGHGAEEMVEGRDLLPSPMHLAGKLLHSRLDMQGRCDGEDLEGLVERCQYPHPLLLSSVFTSYPTLLSAYLALPDINVDPGGEISVTDSPLDEMQALEVFSGYLSDCQHLLNRKYDPSLLLESSSSASIPDTILTSMLSRVGSVCKGCGMAERVEANKRFGRKLPFMALKGASWSRISRSQKTTVETLDALRHQSLLTQGTMSSRQSYVLDLMPYLRRLRPQNTGMSSVGVAGLGVESGGIVEDIEDAND